MSVGKLYMTDISPPVRAVLLAEKALGITLEHVEVSILKGDQLKPEYLKLNPQHTIPMYVDQDGTKIWDSHSIMAFLVTKYGKTDALYPKDAARRAVVDQRLHFDSGNLFPFLRMFVKETLTKQPVAVREALVEIVKTSYDFVNKFLEGEKWIAGAQVTIADFSVLTSASALSLFVPIDSAAYPNLAKWLKQCDQLPYISAHADGFKKLETLFQSMTTK